MDKYRLGNFSLNSTLSPTNVHHHSNKGPLYTISGTQRHYHHQRGPQLFMDTPSIGTSTKFQFVPGTHFSTAKTSTTPLNMGSIGSNFAPLLNSVKTFFLNLLKPNVETDTTKNNVSVKSDHSSPNHYLDIMSDRKHCSDFDKTSFVDLSDYNMLSKLSASTKSFADYDEPVNTNKINFMPKTQEISNKIEFCSVEQPPSNPTKEIEVNLPIPVPEDLMKTRPSFTPLQQKGKQNRKQNKMRRQCHGKKPKLAVAASVCANVNKEKARKTVKMGKNKKEKHKHELVQTIHEDVETEIEVISMDEWDEPILFLPTLNEHQTEQVAATNSKLAPFSNADFPPMPTMHAEDDATKIKQPLKFPMQSSLPLPLIKERHRQISECDSEDSFIVFEHDDEFLPSSMESTPSICEQFRSTVLGERWHRQRQISESSDDDFICFEKEGSDVDGDSDCDSDEDEEETNTLSSITDQPVEATGKKKVRFNLQPKVHVLHVWSFAFRHAREGKWEQIARDRVRFYNRISSLESILLPILDSTHREKIYNLRFLKTTDDASDCAI